MMFNKTFVTTGKTDYVPYEKAVTHNYAPITEQAKYLDELKKEAWDSVVKVVAQELGDNHFSVAVVYTNHAYLDKKFYTRAVFKLNGEVFDIVAETDECERCQFYEKMAKALSQKITSTLIAQLSHQAVS